MHLVLLTPSLVLLRIAATMDKSPLDILEAVAFHLGLLVASVLLLVVLVVYYYNTSMLPKLLVVVAPPTHRSMKISLPFQPGSSIGTLTVGHLKFFPML
mmetsp:Transcript_38158/g.93583  ORF Transcript_38158/g.93583 Transcript_38158/m.93583 type:complete len:99 (-) Transcript_38158:269-565(-)